MRGKRWVVPHPIAAPSDLLSYFLGVQPKPRTVKKKAKPVKRPVKKGKKKKVKKKAKKKQPPSVLDLILS